MGLRAVYVYMEPKKIALPAMVDARTVRYLEKAYDKIRSLEPDDPVGR